MLKYIGPRVRGDLRVQGQGHEFEGKKMETKRIMEKVYVVEAVMIVVEIVEKEERPRGWLRR